MFKWNFLHNKKKLKLILPILGIPFITIPLATALTSCSVNNNFDGPVKFPNDGSNNTVENIKPTEFDNFLSIQKSIETQFETLKNWYESYFVGNENNSQYNFPNFNNYFPKNDLLLIEVCKNKFNQWIIDNDAGILFSSYYNIINLMHCLLGLEWLLNSYVSLGLYEYISKVNTQNNVEAIKWIPIPNKNESYIETLYKTYNSYSTIDKYKFNYWINKSLLDYEPILMNSYDFQKLYTIGQYGKLFKDIINLNTYMMNHKLPSSFYEDFNSNGKTTFWDFFTNKDEFPEEYQKYEKEMTDSYSHILEISKFIEILYVEPTAP